MTATGTDQPVEGRFDGREHRFPVRVYFEDTDLSGVVYHANYLRFMERARSDMLRLAGIEREVEMNLADRSGMRFPLLLGRTALAGAFAVDPAGSFLHRRRRARPAGAPRGV